jgi:hypothetical protein
MQSAERRENDEWIPVGARLGGLAAAILTGAFAGLIPQHAGLRIARIAVCAGIAGVRRDRAEHVTTVRGGDSERRDRAELVCGMLRSF